jgi:hypothetical protein
VALSVWVRESGDSRIDLWDKGGVNELIAIARKDPNTYTLLADVDPYGYTIFNGLQCRRLRQELQYLTDDEDDERLREVAVALQQLTYLVTWDIAPNPPGRQLWFIGD